MLHLLRRMLHLQLSGLHHLLMRRLLLLSHGDLLPPYLFKLYCLLLCHVGISRLWCRLGVMLEGLDPLWVLIRGLRMLLLTLTVLIGIRHPRLWSRLASMRLCLTARRALLPLATMLLHGYLLGHLLLLLLIGKCCLLLHSLLHLLLQVWGERHTRDTWIVLLQLCHLLRIQTLHCAWLHVHHSVGLGLSLSSHLHLLMSLH